MPKPSDQIIMDGVVRVSAVGERGGDESYGSPAVQREAMEHWADYRKVQLAKVHVDEDWSGGTQDRPGLRAAIERAVNGETQGIVTYNISRFSRFTEGGLADLRRLREAGARLVFVQEDIDTSTVHGRMIFTILLATHEAALEQIKAGWKVTKARAIREGRQIGPTPPGYRRTTERNGRRKGSLVPDETAGPAITAAYQAVARAQDVRASLPILEAAIPTKTFVARKAQTAARYGVQLGESVTVPATWNSTTARRVLASRVYLGEAYYGDDIDPNPGAHEPLIDSTTWRQVQKIIGVPEEQRRGKPAEYPLSGGPLVCATCEFPMIGARMGKDKLTGGGRRGYRCTTNKRRDEHTCDAPAMTLAEPLEAYVRELLLDHARQREAERVAAWDAVTGGAPLDFRDVATSDLSDAERLLLRAEFGPGPEDVAAEQREALRAAEAERDRVEEQLRGIVNDEALVAALEPYDRAVTDARLAVESAEAIAAEDDPGPPELAEIEGAAAARLGELLERYGLVVRVEPARGDRTPGGRLHERVALVPGAVA